MRSKLVLHLFAAAMVALALAVLPFHLRALESDALAQQIYLTICGPAGGGAIPSWIGAFASH